MFLRVRGKGGSPENSQAALMYIRAFWTVPTVPTPGEYDVISPLDLNLSTSSVSTCEDFPPHLHHHSENATTSHPNESPMRRGDVPSHTSETGSDGSSDFAMPHLTSRPFIFPTFLVGIHRAATTNTRKSSPAYFSSVWKELWNALDILYDEVSLFPVLPIPLVSRCLCRCFMEEKAKIERGNRGNISSSASPSCISTTAATTTSTSDVAEEELRHALEQFNTMPGYGWASSEEEEELEKGTQNNDTYNHNNILSTKVLPTTPASPAKIAICPHYFAEKTRTFSELCPILNGKGRRNDFPTALPAAVGGGVSLVHDHPCQKQQEKEATTITNHSETTTTEVIEDGNVNTTNNIRDNSSGIPTHTHVIVMDLSKSVALSNKLVLEFSWLAAFLSLQLEAVYSPPLPPVKEGETTNEQAHPSPHHTIPTTRQGKEEERREEHEERTVILIRLPFTHVPPVLELTEAVKTPWLPPSSSPPPTTTTTPSFSHPDSKKDGKKETQAARLCMKDEKNSTLMCPGWKRWTRAKVAHCLLQTMDVMGQHLSILWEGAVRQKNTPTSTSTAVSPLIGFLGEDEEETVNGIYLTVRDVVQGKYKRRHEKTAMNPQHPFSPGAARCEPKMSIQGCTSSSICGRTTNIDAPSSNLGSPLSSVSLVWVSSDEQIEKEREKAEGTSAIAVLLQRVVERCRHHLSHPAMSGALREVQRWTAPIKAFKEGQEEEWDIYTQREMARLNFCPCCGDCGSDGGSREDENEGHHSHSHHHH